MPHRNIFKKILFCTDFSENADAAFYYALNIAEGNPESQMVILHIVPEPDAQFWKSYLYEVEDVDKKAQEDIEEKIRTTYLSKMPPGIRCAVKTVMGKADQQILKVAEKESADLLVIGRGNRGGLATIFFGKITEHVARRASCPVLIVPH